MAIQNFVAGGFYGKLGQIVGQRWHNKRTMRTYVVPANPKTEAQQANRALFKKATKLASEAFRTNKGADYWQRDDMGQFSWMVSTAKMRLQNGATDLEALPLFPDSYVPPIESAGLTVSWTNWPTSVRITNPSYTFTENRTMTLFIHGQNLVTGFWEDIEITLTISQGSSLDYTWQHDNYHMFPLGAQISASSADNMQPSKPAIDFLPVSTAQNREAEIELIQTFEPPYPIPGTNNIIIPIINMPMSITETMYFNCMLWRPPSGYVDVDITNTFDPTTGQSYLNIGPDGSPYDTHRRGTIQPNSWYYIEEPDYFIAHCRNAEFEWQPW